MRRYHSQGNSQSWIGAVADRLRISRQAMFMRLARAAGLCQICQEPATYSGVCDQHAAWRRDYKYNHYRPLLRRRPERSGARGPRSIA